MDVLKGFFQKHGWRYLPGMAFLILNAALIAHYGRAMLVFDRLEGRA